MEDLIFLKWFLANIDDMLKEYKEKFDYYKDMPDKFKADWIYTNQADIIEKCHSTITKDYLNAFQISDLPEDFVKDKWEEHLDIMKDIDSDWKEEDDSSYGHWPYDPNDS